MTRGMFYVLAFNNKGECWAKQYFTNESLARETFDTVKNTIKYCGGQIGAKVRIDATYAGSGKTDWEVIDEYVHTAE